VEQGADAVLCQHSHCIGAVERHRGGTILYGQGNFLFNYAAHGALGGQGLGVVVVFPKEGPARLEWHPVEQSPSGPGIRLCSPETAQRVLEGLEERSGILADPARYAEVWSAWCDRQQPAYLTKLFGMGRWLDRLNRGSWMFRRLSLRTLLGIYNVISCESHRATFLGGLDRAIRRLSGRRRT
jgi:poly-gamma-glutamate synthesis protein (capsule biosynthesis protein)